MAAEKALHRHLQGFRVGSTEWFQVHPDDIRKFMKRI